MRTIVTGSAFSCLMLRLMLEPVTSTRSSSPEDTPSAAHATGALTPIPAMAKATASCFFFITELSFVLYPYLVRQFFSWRDRAQAIHIA
ncbi:hypothetical protein [Chromobacterium vaccinii]|uniref:hypothetical protein n=1 Tax=Chromobacterium vaccinii TaxID=1108595 RepID=UPI0032613941